ncbi:MAG TPA: adenylate/guanylate cyclase domain-containing protein [Acidimicrobiales bacterium]|nr:adenylate/guanylate cyclase domain-containing protein [Acidimicrobiales bacterium]
MDDVPGVHTLGGGPDTLAGQRRQVTVLFCDLVGSTALSYQLDPEDLGELVLAYQEVGRAAVDRLGGSIAQYLGDGLMAIFGYPTAHEGDAERAVRAAVEIMEDLDALNTSHAAGLGVQIQARAGIATGVAVMGAMGNPDRVDVSVFGSTTNLAARLESIAPPGAVVLSNRTKVLVGHCCRFADLGEPELKGVGPTRAWRVTELLAPGAAHGLRASPFAGRASELGLLQRRWDRARAGHGSAVTVLGEPGIGKTRLLDELAARTGPPLVAFACSPLQTATPLAPVIAAFARLLADGAEGHGSIGAWAAALGCQDGHLLDMLDGAVDRGPAGGGDRDLRWRRTIAAASDFLIRVLAPGPAVVRAEDVHWADPSTLELWRLLAEAAPTNALVLLASQRTDEGEGLDGSVGEVMRLERLAEDEMAVIVDTMVPAELPDRAGTLRMILDKADGIPLFAEELAAAVSERQAATDVPASLHEALLSRLDRFGETARAARLASVVGRDVSSKLITQLAGRDMDDDLDKLVASGLMVRVGTGTDTIVSFRHALIRDTAYSSLLRRDRKRIHAAVAELLVAGDAAYGQHQPQVLAHHLEAAGHNLDAAAILRTAGRRAGGDGAYRESIDLIERGLTALGPAPAGEVRDRLELELVGLLANGIMAAEGYGAERTMPLWNRGIVLAEAQGDVDQLTSMLNGVATYHFDTGHCDAAAVVAQRILDIAAEEDLRIAALRGHCTLALCNIYLGHPTETMTHSRLALSLYQPEDFEDVTLGLGTDHKVIALGAGAMASWLFGQPDRALTLALDGVDHADTIGSRLSGSMAMSLAALVHYLRGDHDAALVMCDRLIAEASLLRFPYWLAFANMIRGASTALSGQPRRGLELVQSALEALASSGSSSGASLGLTLLARSQAAGGDHAGAFASLELAEAVSAQAGQPFFDAEVLRLQAQTGFTAGIIDLEGARSRLHRAVSDAHQRGAAALELRAALTWATIEPPEHRRRAVELLDSLLAAMPEGTRTEDRRTAQAIVLAGAAGV